LTTHTYDANGNTLVAGAKTFGYDSLDRMASFNSGAVTMVYDGDGNRLAKVASGSTTSYLVDEENPTGLAQVVEEIAGGVVQRRYLYGLGRISQSEGGTVSYYGYDAHGDVRFLTDSTGTVTDTYDYDAWGNVVSSTGTTANVYRYQGEALDTETGLYYLRARYYDPLNGRFLNVDPLADAGQRPYLYAGADPQNRKDPTGRQEVIEYSLLMWLFAAQVPPPKDQFSCWDAIVFSDLSPTEILARMAANCPRDGLGRDGKKVPGKKEKPCWTDLCRIVSTLDDLGKNIEEVAAQNHGFSSDSRVKLTADIDSEAVKETGAIRYLVGQDPPRIPPKQWFNGGHFNLVLMDAGLSGALQGAGEPEAFYEAFGKGTAGSHRDAVYGKAAVGHYTMHSHGEPGAQYNFHFDMFNPLKDVVSTIGHLFGDVLGGHLGVPCLDPAWR
jgi:RHS repeat-associated protein